MKMTEGEIRGKIGNTLRRRGWEWFTARELRDEIRPREDSRDFARILKRMVKAGSAVTEIRMPMDGPRVAHYRHRDAADRGETT